MEVADCFGCNFWKSGSPSSLLWGILYRCILCRDLGLLSVAALQVSFLTSETCDKYFFDGAISGKETGVEGVVVVVGKRGEDAAPGLSLLRMGATPGAWNEHLCPGAV